MNISDVGHAFARKKNPDIDRADPVIAHAVRECCTYVVDVMHKMGIRTYDAQTARKLARELLHDELGSSEKWAAYLQDTAPQMQQQLLTIVLSNPDSGS